MNDFVEWLKAVLGTQYKYWIGDWVETQTTSADFYCAVRQEGGARPSVDDRRARYAVVLLGRRESRGDAQQVLDAAQSLMQASISGVFPCSFANLRAMGESIGPSATTENRAWVKLVFEATT